ncbi:unnamed protein product [Calypogeia fissa]
MREVEPTLKAEFGGKRAELEGPGKVEQWGAPGRRKGGPEGGMEGDRHGVAFDVVGAVRCRSGIYRDGKSGAVVHNCLRHGSTPQPASKWYETMVLIYYLFVVRTLGSKLLISCSSSLLLQLGRAVQTAERRPVVGEREEIKGISENQILIGNDTAAVIAENWIAAKSGGISGIGIRVSGIEDISMKEEGQVLLRSRKAEG